MKKYYFIIAVLVAIEIALIAFRGYAKSTQIVSTTTPVAVTEPAPVVEQKPVIPSQPKTQDTEIKILDSVDYSVPFTAQAPTANWDAFHDEACEEASALMVWHYFNKTKLGSTDDVEKELQNAAAWERTNVGTDVSISAKDTVRMLKEHFNLSARLIEAVTKDSLKKELSAGRLIILPAQGQFLHNPNFKQPGPRYHMLVVRGYDGSGTFITNDPGTRKGEKYPYAPDVLLNAIHDWNNGDVENGAKVAIVVDGTL